tara:strand:- start:560 stop:1003 length:444 start_codon:yes stop_codon:yes gene_type:complete
MNYIATAKYVNMLDPVSQGSGAYTADNVVDTAGYSYLTVVVSTGASAGMSALKLQESDASNMSGATDVSGTTIGTALDIDGGTSTLPSASDDEIHVINVDLRGKKRYVSFAATASGTTLTSVLGVLTRAAEATNVLADRGVNTMVDA